MEDDEGPLADLGEAAVGQALVNGLDLVVVETLSERDVELDAELVVDFLEGGHRDLVDVFPDGEVFGIAGLEFHEFLAGFFEHGGIGVGGVVADFVEAFELFEWLALEGGGIELAFVGPDEFAELSAPVADVIIADDACAGECEEAADGLADHG